jgi:hypothetical protein
MKCVSDDALMELHARLGGISAVDTVQGRVLGDRTCMVALGAVPSDVRRFLPPSTPVVGDEAHWKTLADIPSEPGSVGHFCVLGTSGASLLPPAIREISVDGKKVSADAITKVDLIISGASTVVGFGSLTRERIEGLGREHDLVILTGAQNLGTADEVERYFDAVDTLHAGGASVALCYSEPKHKHVEMEIWKAVRERSAIAFLGLNTGEASELLERIGEAAEHGNPLELDAATRARIIAAREVLARPDDQWGAPCESPEWLFRCACVLQEILRIPAVRVRGRASDVLVTGPGISPDHPEQTAENLVLSRLLGTLKVGSPAGLFTHREQLAYLRNPPDGKGLAALHAVADCARALEGGAGDGHDLAAAGWMRLADGRSLFADVPMPFFVKDGGTASAGDTMDYTFASREVWNLLRSAGASHPAR